MPTLDDLSKDPRVSLDEIRDAVEECLQLKVSQCIQYEVELFTALILCKSLRGRMINGLNVE